MDFIIQAGHKVKLKESEKWDKYPDLACELKKTLEHESDNDTNCNWCTQYRHQKIGTGTGRLGNKKTSGDHPNYRIAEINQNTKNSPGDLRRLAVTSVENHLLTLVRKTLKWIE